LLIVHHYYSDIVDAKVSIGRIQKYLEMQEILENTSPADTISFKSASIAWPQDDMGEDQNARFVLRNIDLAFPHGQLSVISGKTGSGKSLLLASLLGECDLLEGVIQRPKPPSIDVRFDHKATADNWIIPSSIAYVAQIPWIENATIKDNIIFGLPFSVVRYKKTLSACSLERDLDILVDGEMTEIGANGINLSGGQRWRVTLARALYSRAGILVLDDIFGAVDVQVGRWIFENALTGELGQGRTRILATHHPALCISRATFAVILGHGTIEQAGSIDDLTISGSPINMLERKAVAVAKEGEYQMPDDIIVQKLKRTMSHSSANFYANTTENAKPRTYIEEEHRESGSVKKRIYLEYFRASGGLFYWCICLFVFICASVILFMRSWWVKVWTSSYEVESVVNMSCVQRYNHHTQTPFCLENLRTEPAITNNLPFYMGIYFVLSIGGCLISTLRQFYVFTLAIRGSRNLFDAMIYAVLRTPLRWVDTVPVGRILNRFAADFDVIDSNLANDLSFTMESILQIVTTMAAGLFLSPFIIISGSALLLAAFYTARLYINGAREINRLESNSKSPILDQVSF
jgi:ABC-type multidrug transport system fused ATPase/permease subunit